MKLTIRNFTIADFAAVATWAVVFSVSMIGFNNASPPIKQHSAVIIFGFIAYAVFMLAALKEGLLTSNPTIRRVFLFLQLASAFLIMWHLPTSFLPILTVLWVAILPNYFSWRQSIFIMVAVVVTWFTVYSWQWNIEGVYLVAILYSTFHFFALLMSYQKKLAENATVEAQRLNKELQATQYLLSEASRQNERTRIARDLHDLIGHHLTALIINLQVAAHESDGCAKEKVEQCHSIARLLLNDVRDAVTTLRENQQLDFKKVLELMVENLPKLIVHQQIKYSLVLDDLALAKTLLYCIQESLTNSLRHSGATEFWITLDREGEHLKLELVDNGLAPEPIKNGNGLNGMQERVQELGGDIAFEHIHHSLTIRISIPLESKDKLLIKESL